MHFRSLTSHTFECAGREILALQRYFEGRKVVCKLVEFPLLLLTPLATIEALFWAAIGLMSFAFAKCTGSKRLKNGACFAFSYAGTAFWTGIAGVMAFFSKDGLRNARFMRTIVHGIYAISSTILQSSVERMLDVDHRVSKRRQRVILDILRTSIQHIIGQDRVIHIDVNFKQAIVTGSHILHHIERIFEEHGLEWRMYTNRVLKVNSRNIE